MPNWIIPKDAARGLVDHGTQRVQKSIQTVKKALPLQEEPVVLIRVSSGWTRLETGGYRATGVMIGASGNVRSGEVFVYAPTAASADDLPSSGKRIHAAKVNGRWEMIQGGSGGGDVDITAGQGIAVTEYDNSYRIDNMGVLSVGRFTGGATGGIRTKTTRTPLSRTQEKRVYFHQDWFEIDTTDADTEGSSYITPNVSKIRGTPNISAVANGGVVTFTVGINYGN